MIRQNEVTTYLNNKKEIFLQLINAIDEAHSIRKNQIYIKGINVLEEKVDVIAKKAEWPSILNKALVFFEGTEDYESCQLCKTISNKLEIKKKLKVNDKDSTTQRN